MEASMTDMRVTCQLLVDLSCCYLLHSNAFSQVFYNGPFQVRLSWSLSTYGTLKRNLPEKTMNPQACRKSPALRGQTSGSQLCTGSFWAFYTRFPTIATQYAASVFQNQTISPSFFKMSKCPLLIKVHPSTMVLAESKVNISLPKQVLSPGHLQSGSCLLPRFLCLLQKQKTEYEHQAVRCLTVFYSWSIYSQFNCIFNANYNTLIFN